MKSCINSVVILCSLSAATGSFGAVQDTQTQQNAVVIGVGNDLRCRLEKGVRITKAGEPIAAKLAEPVFVGTTIALPEGSTIKGHVISISRGPRRVGQILGGDFTPPRIANISFDQALLPDGTTLQIHTETTTGISDIQTAKYLPKSQ